MRTRHSPNEPPSRARSACGRSHLVWPHQPMAQEQGTRQFGHGPIFYDHDDAQSVLRSTITPPRVSTLWPAAEMAPFRDAEFGNPSSVHRAGRSARDAVERARDQVAALIGAAAEEIVFTSGGTEGDNLAIFGAAEAARAADPKRTRLVTSGLEHPAVLAPVAALARRGFGVTRLPVDAEGRIDPADLGRVLGDDVALVTLQLVNHELGNRYPLAERPDEPRLRVPGSTPTRCRPRASCLSMSPRSGSMSTVSSHKLCGPKGVGALRRRGRSLGAHLVGGHQERERRPGTENVAGHRGLRRRLRGDRGTRLATQCAASASASRRARSLSVHAWGTEMPRGPTTSNLAFARVPGDLLVESLDLAGVAASTGAACSSGSREPSPVLRAIDWPEGLRVQLGAGTRPARSIACSFRTLPNPRRARTTGRKRRASRSGGRSGPPPLRCVEFAAAYRRRAANRLEPEGREQRQIANQGLWRAAHIDDPPR